MLIQLSINCRIRHCRVCCLVPWAVTQSSRARAARRDWLQHLRIMCSIMLMRLQDLCKSCRTFCYFILFWRKVAKFLHNSCARILSYFILLQMGEPLNGGTAGWTNNPETVSPLPIVGGSINRIARVERFWIALELQWCAGGDGIRRLPQCRPTYGTISEKNLKNNVYAYVKVQLQSWKIFLVSPIPNSMIVRICEMRYSVSVIVDTKFSISILCCSYNGQYF